MRVSLLGPTFLLMVVALIFGVINKASGEGEGESDPKQLSRRDLRLYGTVVTTRVDYSRQHLTTGLIKTDSPNIVRVFDTKSISGSFKGLEKTNSLDDSHQVLFSIYSKNSTVFGISTFNYLTGESLRPEFYFTGVNSIFCSFFDSFLEMIYIVGTRSLVSGAPVELMGLDVYAWKEIASGSEEYFGTVTVFDGEPIDSSSNWDIRFAPLHMCYFNQANRRLYLTPFLLSNNHAIMNGQNLTKLIEYDIESFTVISQQVMSFNLIPYPIGWSSFFLTKKFDGLVYNPITQLGYATFSQFEVSRMKGLWLVEFNPLQNKFDLVMSISNSTTCDGAVSTYNPQENIMIVYCSTDCLVVDLKTLRMISLPSFPVSPTWIGYSSINIISVNPIAGIIDVQSRQMPSSIKLISVITSI